jgi:YD repeat-containing protein
MRFFRGALGYRAQRARLHLFATILGGMFALAASAGHATAGGDSFLGWQSHGQYFGSPDAACLTEFNYYIPPDISQFIGSTPEPNNQVFARCHWTTAQQGNCTSVPPAAPCTNVLPNGVGYYCLPGSTPNGWFLCQQTPVRTDDKCGVGNPIMLDSGAKREQRTDFKTSDGRLDVKRTYTSIPQLWRESLDLWRPVQGNLGGWAFDFSFEWHMDVYIGTSTYGGTLHTPDGNAFEFDRSANSFTTAAYNPTYDYTLEIAGTPPSDWSMVRDAVSQWKLKELNTGRTWLLQTFRHDPNDATSSYSIARPISVTAPDGYVQTFAYGAKGELATITDSYGRTLSFAWRQYVPTAIAAPVSLPYPEVIEQITLPDSTKLVYSYDPPAASPSSGRALRLTGVARKTAANVTVETIAYHYEDARYPTFLTGITDSRGIRFATFAYDGQGRAILSEHAGGVGKTTVAYSTLGSDLVRTVTNALGKVTVYTFAKPPISLKTGIYLLKTVNGQSSTNCASSNSSLTYRDDGFYGPSVFKESETDEEGRVTKYTRDTLGRPLTMIRGFGTPSAVTTSYSWNPAWSTPVQIIQPGLTLDYTRNAAGQLTQVRAPTRRRRPCPMRRQGRSAPLISLTARPASS